VVIAGRPLPPDSVADLVLAPGVEDACAALKQAGFLLIVVTNQPDLARGTRDRGGVDAINDALRARLGLDDVLVCPHDDADGCAAGAGPGRAGGGRRPGWEVGGGGGGGGGGEGGRGGGGGGDGRAGRPGTRGGGGRRRGLRGGGGGGGGRPGGSAAGPGSGT